MKITPDLPPIHQYISASTPPIDLRIKPEPILPTLEVPVEPRVSLQIPEAPERIPTPPEKKRGE